MISTARSMLLVLLATCCVVPAARAQVAGDGEPRQVEILAPSDSLVQVIEGGERVQRLFGNVRLRQGTTLLNADRAAQYRDRGEIIFNGNVLIVDEGDSLWADRVRYDSRQKIGRATGDVRVADGEVLLAGPVGQYYFEEKHAVFPERVTLVDSARVLKSRSGEYFSREARVEFYRQVQVFSDSTYLEADSVTYRRDTEVSEARRNVFIERRGDRTSSSQSPSDRASAPNEAESEERGQRPTLEGERQGGGVRTPRPSLLGRSLPVDTTRRGLLPDTTARTLLWGNYAYSDPQSGYSRVTGSALLVRLEPPDEDDGASEADASSPRGPTDAPPDTLVVRARQLETTRTGALRRLTATDSVRLWQQDLQAVSDSAVYDRRAARGAEEQRQESRFFGTPISWSTGPDGNAGAQLSGDSLRVTGRAGQIRRLYAHGNAFLAQEDSALAGRLRQLKGGRITGDFARSDSTGETELRRLLAGPNAEAIYFRKNDDGTLAGATRASSDSVYFHIENGALRKIRFLRGVEGLDRMKAEDVPDPFRLDGLVWVPERRPRKEVFLEEPRVRQRLTRPVPPRQAPAREEERLAPAPPVPASTPAEASSASSSAADGRRSDE